MSTTLSTLRVRWTAIGAAVAVSLGAGGIGLVNATTSSGERAVYTAINPCRLVDTRPDFAVGDKTSALGPTELLTIAATGSSGECTGIPTDVTAVELNVTAVGATQPTHLTTWPGGPRPNASSLNPAPGQPPTPNAVTTDLAVDGTFQMFNLQGNVHVVVDLVGIYQDHDHDDRYYTRTQVDAAVTDAQDALTGPFVLPLAPAEFLARRTVDYGTVDPGGGIELIDATPITSEFFDSGVPLPAGTTIDEIRVFLDPNGDQTSALFERKDPLTGANEVLGVATSTNGADPEEVVVDLDHITEEGWTYRLVVRLNEQSQFLLGAEVAYELPSP